MMLRVYYHIKGCDNMYFKDTKCKKLWTLLVHFY